MLWRGSERTCPGDHQEDDGHGARGHGGLASAAVGPSLPGGVHRAIHVKVRDGQVANRAFYCAIGVTVEGKRDILGIWASPGAEGAKFWLNVLTELKTRGVADVCIVCCDGLKGLPEDRTSTRLNSSH